MVKTAKELINYFEIQKLLKEKYDFKKLCVGNIDE